MKPSTVIFIAVMILAAMAGSAFVVRDGLLAIAAAIRDKPLPDMPKELSVSDLTIEHATIKHAPPGDGKSPNVTLTIENMRIDTPVNQPLVK